MNTLVPYPPRYKHRIRPDIGFVRIVLLANPSDPAKLPSIKTLQYILAVDMGRELEAIVILLTGRAIYDAIL